MPRICRLPDMAPPGLDGFMGFDDDEKRRRSGGRGGEQLDPSKVPESRFASSELGPDIMQPMSGSIRSGEVPRYLTAPLSPCRA